MLCDPITVTEWRKNSRETLRVRLDVFQGTPVIDLRAWYLASEGNLRPGRGGLTVSIAHLPALADGLRKALQEAIARELLPPDA